MASLGTGQQHDLTHVIKWTVAAVWKADGKRTKCSERGPMHKSRASLQNGRGMVSGNKILDVF